VNRAYIVLTVWVVIISGMLPLIAQSNAGGVVPRLVNYSGKAVDAQAKTLMGVAGVTFAICKEQTDGAPLWWKLRTRRRARELNYSVQLGATQPDGLALESAASQIVRLKLIMLLVCICK